MCLRKMQISKIVNSVFTSNTFVLTSDGSDWCWLVDVGDIDPLLPVIGEREVRGVFITHTHYDHIYGLPSLLERFPDCFIYTSAEGKEGLASDKFNFSRYHGDPIRYEGPNVRVLQDCDSVEMFDDVRMTAMMTPGHDKSSVTFYTDDSVFTGDSYIPGFDVVTTFPRSNKSDADSSLKKINILLETRKIYPGHQ